MMQYPLYYSDSDEYCECHWSISLFSMLPTKTDLQIASTTHGGIVLF